MKIFYTATSRIPSRAANSVHVMKMSQAFQDAGNETSLIIPAERLPSADEIDRWHAEYGVRGTFSLSPIAVGKRKAKSLRYMAGFARRILKERPDFVYGRSLFGLWTAAKMGVPCAYEMHSPIAEYPRLERTLFKSLVNSRAYLGTTVISEALSRLVSRETPVLAMRPVIVAHDGADVPSSSPANLEGTFKVGYIGSLYPGRGIDVILRVAESVPEATFHIIGGTEEDVRYWKERVSATNVIFHGHVSPARTPEYQLAMDVLLAPYQRKVQITGGRGDTSAFMSPLKIFEYMAAHKAIVCSDMPVLREVLDDECAVLIPSLEDPGSWTQAVRRLQQDAVLRQRHADAAFSRFQSRYTWSIRAKSISDAFALLLRDKRRAGTS